MSLNALYDEMAVATQQYFAPKVVDQIFKSNPFAMRVRRNAKTIGGGEAINLSSIYAKGDGQWFGEWDNYSAAYKEQLGAGKLDWKLYTTAVVLSTLQLLKNADSPERRYDLAKLKNIIASKTAADDLGTAIFALTQNALALDSLDFAVSTNAEHASYAGITRTASGDAAVWNSNIQSDTMLTLPGLQTGYGNAQEGDERPNLSVTCQANFNRYWNLLTPLQRLGSEEMGRAGFTSLLFNGHPVVVDSHVASVANGDAADYWYMLNMNHIQLIAHRLAFFIFARAVMPSNQWVNIGRFYFVGNLACHAPRYQAKFNAIVT